MGSTSSCSSYYRDLLARADILTVAREKGVLDSLRRQGRLYVGPCPSGHGGASKDHFQLDPGRGTFVCRHAGCELHGDALELAAVAVANWQTPDKVHTDEARDWLARLVGLPALRSLPPEEIKAQEERRATETQIFATLTRWVANCAAALQGQTQLLDNLMTVYGLRRETVAEWQVGFADSVLQFSGPGGTFTVEELRAAGLVCTRQDVPYFVNRLILPHWDRSGRVVYCQARQIAGALAADLPADLLTPHTEFEQGKYKGLRERGVVQKVPLHDLNHAEEGVVLVEGDTDCLAVAQAGWPVLGLSTANPPPEAVAELVAQLRRYRRIYLCFDADTVAGANGQLSHPGPAGARRMARLLEDAGAKHVYVAALCEPPATPADPKVDPASWLRDLPADGPTPHEALRGVLAAARPLLSLLIDDLPQTTAGAQLQDVLDPVLQRLATRPELEWLTYLQQIQARFQLTGAQRTALAKLTREMQRETKRLQVDAELQAHAEGRVDFEDDPLVVGQYDSIFHGLCTLELELRAGKDGVFLSPKRVPPTARSRADFVFQFLKAAGTRFFYDSSANISFMLHPNGQPLRLDPGDECFRSWWLDTIRLYTPDRPAGKELLRALDVHLRDPARAVQIHSSNWGHWDREAGTITLPLGDLEQRLLVIAPAVEGEPQLRVGVMGEIGEVVVLPPQSLRRGWAYQEHLTLDQGLPLLLEVLADRLPLDTDDQLASLAFDLTSFLPNLAQRPIKHHTGEQGSGKSLAAEIWSAVLYGEKVASQFGNEEEFWSALDRNPLVVQDNAEAETKRLFSNLYLSAATGQGSQRRKLFTNSDKLWYRPNGTILVTSILAFEKDEELERIVPFEFGKRFQRTKISRETVVREAIARRSQLLTTITQLFSVFLAEQATVTRYFEQLPDHPKRRFNDFFAAMEWFYVVLHDQRNHQGVHAARSSFYAWLQRLAEEHEDTFAGSNPLVRYLNWMVRSPEKGWGVVLRQLTAVDDRSRKSETIGWVIEDSSENLLAAFRKVAREYNEPVHDSLRNAKILGQRIQGSTEALVAAGWEAVKRRTNRSNGWSLTYTMPRAAGPGTEPDYFAAIDNRQAEVG